MIECFEHATAVFVVVVVIDKNNGDDKSIARKPEQEKKIKEVYGVCLK